ncbi:MAG: SpoIIIAH-like family protein [Oscillospiraceae bacterium]|jgi:stage III sporulation protein AH|nr:SpoIIIAH-like family protein [Oscillospiraceae bacterium]
MKKLLKKRQLVLMTLVLALGAAVFVNWYYSRPDTAVDGKPMAATTAAAANTTPNEHLGDSQYVHNPYSTAAGEYFAGAKLRRQAAHDEAKETLDAVITDSKASAKAVADAGKSLQKLASAIKLEADCESLITAKTGSECLVMIDDENVQAVLGGEPIDGATALQIKEILLGKTGLDSDRVTIVELNR